MATSHISASHACNLVSRITVDDDGSHAPELLELVEGLAAPNDPAGLAVISYLRKMVDSDGCDCVISACAGLLG